MTPFDRPLRLRMLLWLYSNANLAGCALALLGPLMLFVGVIAHGWLPITAGLYAAGALLFLRSPGIERRIEDSLTVDQTLERLDGLVARASPHLNDDMRRGLASIRTSVAEVLPRLLASAAAGDDLFVVRETVLRYLPETLANYVALPPAFRATHVLQGGRTARDLLADQLRLLDQKLREVVANVAASDAQALVANGQFLEAKFRQPDFLAS
jgi:hypothetical protein